MQFSRLVDLGQLPTQIGGIPILFRTRKESWARAHRYNNPDWHKPRLVKGRFDLPMAPETEFSLIADATQFLLFYLHRGQTWENHLWFWGGRDGKEAFFRRVYVNSMNAFRHGDEEKFFDSLVPPKVRVFQRMNDEDVERLGLLFICMTGMNWKTLEYMTRAFVTSAPKIQRVRNMQLFGTPNRFTGDFLELHTVQRYWWGIGQGEITGPYGSRTLHSPSVMEAMSQWG